ncbi:TPA: hypothetical protein N0F65_003371 [Lagenidium giganteum]|uniref:HTH CENPB-type domain-containing protein n=1 Tax=Lagenidium giganteum TaxID=4803 RepID=A0AAV2ZCC8_9STRA|nr:TPA: hypothetical protein N0F65_003371 [Lagenidium giganteum]
MQTTIYRWRKEKNVLLARTFTTSNGRRDSTKRYVRKPGVGTALPHQAEQEILEWINHLRKDGAPVSNLMLQLKAREVAKSHNVPFVTASWDWRRSFRRRHRLSIRARTRQGQVTPADADQIARDFDERVVAAMRNLARTVDQRGERTVWMRSGEREKNRVTVMLLGDNNGNQYTPFVVMKSTPSSVPGRDQEKKAKQNGFGPCVWRQACSIMADMDVILHANATAW